MPLYRNKNNKDVFIDYKLPKRKRNLMTKEFLQTFKEELDNIFNKDDDYEQSRKRNYWNTYQYIEGSAGFYRALELACKKHNLTKALYKYACKMDWYDSDIFDGEITLLMVKKGVIEEGSIDEIDCGIDDSYYEKDEDFELEVTIEEYKGYNVITKDWVVKEN